MNITSGGTRIVLVCSSFVIKIPRFKILRAIRQLFVHTTNKQVKKRLQKFDENVIRAGLKYIFAGLIANRLECYYSKKHPTSKSIMPVRGYLYGLIVVQPRGEVLPKNHPRWIKTMLFLHKNGFKETESSEAFNFCLFKGTMRLLDYGKLTTLAALELKGLKLIEQIPE